jgi:hypothetical protein
LEWMKSACVVVFPPPKRPRTLILGRTMRCKTLPSPNYENLRSKLPSLSAFRRRRKVVVGLPQLWCTLQLHCYDVCYDSYLERSRGCPLSLRIACFGDVNELRHVLEPYIKQIPSLTLDFFHCDKNSSIIEDFCSLEELIIHK